MLRVSVDGPLVAIRLAPGALHGILRQHAGVLDIAGYIRLGRYSFSWAVGSELNIGLHPTTDGLALVGCGLVDSGHLARDVEALHFAMRRVSMAAATLERT